MIKMGDVMVCKLDFEGHVCIFDDIERLIEEVRLFWTEDGPEQGVGLKITFSTMPEDEFRALPEFPGW